MNHKNRWIFFLLAIVTAANIYAAGAGATILRYITKPLLMPLLILAYILGHDPKNIYTRLMISGLCFSWLGDILLMPEDSDGLYFIMGLSCFLTTHILYIFYFLKISSREKSFFSRYPYLLLFIGIYGAGLLYFLWPYLGGLRIPVTLYALIICSMLVMALWQFKRIPWHIAGYFIAGAALFVISDSLLAVNKFRQPLPFAGMLIMATYVAAQAAIVLGGLSHQRWNQAINEEIIR